MKNKTTRFNIHWEKINTIEDIKDFLIPWFGYITEEDKKDSWRSSIRRKYKFLSEIKQKPPQNELETES